MPQPALRALATLLALSAPALAAGPEPLPDRLTAEGRDIPPADWRAKTEGRTVWYRIGPVMWGREHYHPGTNRITFQFPDGDCLDAVWSFDDGWYCFDFGPALEASGPHCFRHLALDDRLFALSSRGDPQEIDRIDRTPLSCGASPTS